jgi:hypothetical protein
MTVSACKYDDSTAAIHTEFEFVKSVCNILPFRYMYMTLVVCKTDEEFTAAIHTKLLMMEIFV